MSTEPITPPPLGATPRTGWGDGRPSGLANGTIGLTAATALLTLLGAFASASVYENFDRYVGSEPDIDASYILSQLLQSLSSLTMIGAYVTLCLWMMKIHRRLTEAGESMPLGPVWAWFVWLIPVANIVMPYLYFRGLNRRARSWAVAPWWLSYLASGAASLVGAAQFVAASDFSRVFKDQDNPFDGLDFAPLGAAGIASAALLAVSWLFLTVTIRDITSRDLG